MIKRIRVDQLEVGMFIHSITTEMTAAEGSIKQHLLKNKKSIQVIQSWGIQEVYIDTSKDTRPKTVQEVQHLIDDELHRLAKEAPSIPLKVPLKKEIHIAKSVTREAVDVIQRALGAIKKDAAINVKEAYSLIEKMEQSVTRNQDALILLTRIKKKDEYTLMHSISVGSLVLAFCKFCHVPYDMMLNLAVGALFHDLGKIRIPSSILNKPGRLSDAEYNIMKKHPEYSATILKNASGLPLDAYDIALHHHERFDGTGYPHNLKGGEISFGAQIAAICDVYDAMTSNRCYRKGLDSRDGLRKIYDWSGTHFNKELTFKFIRCIGVYPVGTYVKLENSLIGVVTESTENILQPIVRIFYDDQKKCPISVEDLNLFETGMSIASYESSEKWDSYNIPIVEGIYA